MKKQESLITSDKVLARLFDIIGHDNDNYLVKTWSNCREQGYYIINYGEDRYPSMSKRYKSIVFAGHRNDPSLIIIVHGYDYQFNITTHQPTQELWDNNSAICHNVDSAVAHILDKIGFIKETFEASA
jgi:hypothetical protein